MNASRSPLLTQTILHAQRVRSRALAAVFGAAAAILLIGEGIQHLAHGGTWVPTALVPFVLLLSLQQLVLARFISGRVRRGRAIPEWLWPASAFLEVTLVTGTIAAIAASFENPVHALPVPAVLAYFVFIIFSTLRLDPRISLFTGAMAAVQYLGLALVTLALTDAAGDLPPVLGSPFIYCTRAALLLAGGVGAAFVARELRGGIERAVAAQRERDRMEATDRAKSAFLAHMSHEIRAPLNAILGYVHLLKKDPTLSDEQRHAVATIDAGGDHLLGVVNQVLDLSRIEAGRQELDVRAFDLAALLTELSAMFELRCRQKGLRWTLRAPAAAGRVLGDADRLRQVLINLLENAVQATESGAVRLEVERDDERARFHAVDTGPGVPIPLQGSIFEPFRQVPAGSRSGGAGLGLAIARAQTELMGGTLALESAPGEGSRFTVELRLPRASAADPFDRWSDDAVRLAPGCRITALVVDDLAADRAVLAALLEELGVETRQAADAESALAAMREARPDVVFTDIRMPAVDGPALLARLTAEGLRDGVRVVAVSASALAHERRAIVEAGFDAFLPKPVRVGELAARIAELPGARFERDPEPAAAVAPAGAGEAAGGSGGEAGGDGPAAGIAAVPRALWLRLRSAAEAYNITELKSGIEELSRLGGEVEPLAAELRALGRAYDMERIVEVLDGAPHA